MDAVSDADAARMLAKKQKRAKRNKKLASYGTKAARKQSRTPEVSLILLISDKPRD